MKTISLINYNYTKQFSTLTSEISKSVENLNICQIIKGKSNSIENLICLTESEKQFLNNNSHQKIILKIHKRHLQINNTKFDNNFFN